MKPELKDPINAIGAAAAIIGGCGIFSILFNSPDWLAVAGFILWLIGICILAIHDRKK